ncbi:hypothetical protein BJ165DRAFT_1521917 [Panaeolus papilionaceus]|nr:hypothetical protein BJ165DRAFT_1521917 [Panaeolus papilionaceus]
MASRRPSSEYHPNIQVIPWAPSQTTPGPSRTPHYRPFSQLYSNLPPVQEFQSKSERFLKRSSSVGGGRYPFPNMGLGFKEKTRTKVTVTRPSRQPLPASPTLRLTPPPPSTTLPSQASSSTSSSTSHANYNAASLSSGPTLRPVKKKRSVASMIVMPFSASESIPTPSSSPVSASSPTHLQPLLIDREDNSSSLKEPKSPRHDSPEQRRQSHQFAVPDDPTTAWAMRHNMKLHPFKDQHVPYMQSYDPVLLESDRYTDILLQRLGGGSPSFHDYGKKPPTTALDLGCGEGHWVLHAATTWKSSEITGFDLVNVTLPALETTENAHFVQGNFLDPKLPFADQSFDYVRMANLVLCIPYEKWEPLFSEVRRILTPNGRLELIDDQIFFPYGETPREHLTPVKKTSHTVRQVASFDTFDYDAEDLDGATLQGEESADTESTLHSEEGSTRSSFDDQHAMLSESPTVRPLTAYLPPTPSTDPPAIFTMPVSPVLRDTRQARWKRQAFASRDLETVFETMLVKKYHIFARPSEFILDMLKIVFGKHDTGKTRSFHVKLAPADSPIGLPGLTVTTKKATVRTKEKDLEAIVAEEKEKEEFGIITKHHTDPSFGSFGKKMGWRAMDIIKKESKGTRRDGMKVWGRLDESIGSNESRSDKSTTPKPAMNAKAAERLGLPFTPSKSPRFSRSFSEGSDALDSPGLSTPSSSSGSSSSSSSSLSPHHNSSDAPVLSAKAAGRLGISYSVLAAATATSTRKRGAPPPAFAPVQSPGVLVWPSTYIPMTPHELEMHACKYIHTLLGCKYALSEFVSGFEDSSGKKMVDEREFGDLMWDYECFRRARFNWPSETPDFFDDEAEVEPPVLNFDTHNGKSLNKVVVPSPKDARDSFNGQYERDHLTHLRTIRVFEAIKTSRRPSSKYI